MARTKFRTIRRRKRRKVFARKRSAKVASSSPAKRQRTVPQLQPVSESGCSSSTTSASITATGSIASITATGSSVSANKPVETTASAKKLSMKKPTVDSDNSSDDLDISESSSSASSSNTESTPSNSSAAGSSTDADDSLDDCEGYRIFDMPSFAEVLGKAATCRKCQGELQLHESSSARQGLASHLQICCSECSSSHTFPYPLATSSKEKELNQRAVLASRLIGRGRSAMRKFFGVLNMPGYMSSRTYEKYSRRLCAAAEEEAYASMKAAGEEVVRLHTEDPSLAKATADGMVGTTVTCDGTWHKRGFTSLHGVVVVISLVTGQVLDYVTLSKTCTECKKWEKRAGTADYAAWKSTHECVANFHGSSPAMECEGALIMWRRSESRHNLRYTDIISDGDSKTFSLLSEKKPYPVPMKKLECVGHVQKRLGTGLRKLKKEKKLGGRGRLTDNVIDAMQTYYGKAIRNNKGNIKAMQKATLAILYHQSSTTTKTRHKYCPPGPTSWCKYKRGEPCGSRNLLPMDVVREIKPLFARLSDKKLLEKCLHGYTQNQNEALNKEIWSLCPKTINVGARTIRTAAALAVAITNNGWSAAERVAQRLHLPHAKWLARLVKSLDAERLKAARYKALATTKKARKDARRQSKKKNEELKAAEGETYLPGGF